MGGAFSFAGKEGAGGVTRIFCDNHKCEYNIEDEYTAAVTHYVGRLCQTYRRIKIERVMQPDHKPNCKKRGGKYKSDGGRLLK